MILLSRFFLNKMLSNAVLIGFLKDNKEFYCWLLRYYFVFVWINRMKIYDIYSFTIDR